MAQPAPTSPVGGNLDPNLTLGLSNVPNALAEQAEQDNQILLAQAQFPGLEINGVLGGLPVAEQNQEYFAIVFEAVDTSPEIIDHTQFKIIYLCDSQLNVSKPSQDSVAVNNVLQNFERQKNAVVRVDQGTVLNNQLAGLHKIFAIGSIEPICGTQIGEGPLSYVTTMSFQQKGQLGPALWDVAGYYQWLNKTTGFQNTRIVSASSGTTNQGESWTLSEREVSPIQTYYDAVQAEPSGAAVEAWDTEALYDNDYFDSIKILTGSIEGHSRVKVKVGVMVNIVTSSIADLTLAWAQRMQLFSNNQPNYAAPVTLTVYKESEGTVRSLGSTTVALPTYNDSLVFTQNGYIGGFEAGSEVLSMLAFQALSNGPDSPAITIDDIDNFSWGVNGSARAIVVETEYFDVEENDLVYAKLSVPQETTTGLNLGPGVNLENLTLSGVEIEIPGGSVELNAGFTKSLSEWKDVAALRTYSYFAGSHIMTQETPEGDNYVEGITGVTASYVNYSEYNNDPTASIYNYTSSYWIAANNYSSSAEGVGCWITSSTALAKFYGGDYTQIDPGTEEYNILNAEFSPTSSLYQFGPNPEQTNLAKKRTWNRFGFNPIKTPFAPQAGDFIRFEYSNQKRFLIKKVNSSGNVLKLELDRQVPSSTVLDNFIIYRIIEDGQYIILDVKKNNEAGIDQPFSGIVSAQYPSEGLDKRTDQLLFYLKQAGIIET